jgi:hypothetical protein
MTVERIRLDGTKMPDLSLGMEFAKKNDRTHDHHQDEGQVRMEEP